MMCRSADPVGRSDRSRNGCSRRGVVVACSGLRLRGGGRGRAPMSHRRYRWIRCSVVTQKSLTRRLNENSSRYFVIWRHAVNWRHAMRNISRLTSWFLAFCTPLVPPAAATERPLAEATGMSVQKAEIAAGKLVIQGEPAGRKPRFPSPGPATRPRPTSPVGSPSAWFTFHPTVSSASPGPVEPFWTWSSRSADRVASTLGAPGPLMRPTAPTTW